LERAARHERVSRTERPKKTTAFKRTQRVCILAGIVRFYFLRTELEETAQTESPVPIELKEENDESTNYNSSKK
jgi:hypothetical protein